MRNTIDITYLLVPVPEGDNRGIPAPTIPGYYHIVLKRVEIDGKDYDRFEYIPRHVDLCKGGNAKREGDKIILFETDEEKEGYAVNVEEIKAPIKVVPSDLYSLVIIDANGIHHFWLPDGQYDGYSRDVKRED